MKRITLFFWLTLCPVTGIYAVGFLSDTLSILDTKLHNKFSFAARGAYNPNRTQPDLSSSHYGECIDVRIKNNSNEEIALKLEAGTILLSQISNSQNMLVTKTSYYVLQPNEKFLGKVFAMCAELKKNAPDIYVNYKIGNLANPTLCRLAKFIEAHEEQNLAGQYAVWAVSDNASSKELGENYKALNKSQEILDKAGIPISIFSPNTSNKNNKHIITKTKIANQNIQNNSPILLDSFGIAIETTPVYKVESTEGVKIGDNSWWQNEEDIYLTVAGVLLISVLILLLKRSK